MAEAFPSTFLLSVHSFRYSLSSLSHLFFTAYSKTPSGGAHSYFQAKFSYSSLPKTKHSACEYCDVNNPLPFRLGLDLVRQLSQHSQNHRLRLSNHRQLRLLLFELRAHIVMQTSLNVSWIVGGGRQATRAPDLALAISKRSFEILRQVA